MEIYEAVYSQDYISLIVSPELFSEDELPEDDSVFLCGVLSGGYRIIYVKKDYYESIIKNNRLSVELPYILGLMGESELRSAGVLQVLENPSIDLTGNGVLLGIIDTGINYTNESFIYENGVSKILDIWDQTEGKGGQFTCYGTEYSREQINNALKSENPYSVVAQKDEIGHGTKLAEIAAGRRNGQYRGAAPNCDIICVKVKQTTQNREYIKDNFFACDSSDIMNGVDFILKKARIYERPAVFLIGMGTNEGSHTGKSYFEKYLSFAAEKRGVVICVPTGNEADKSHHAFSDETNESAEVNFEIQTDSNKKGFILDIWSYSANRYYLTIALPTGETLESIYLVSGYNQSYQFPLSGTVISVSAEYPVGGSVNQRIRLKFKNVINGIWNVGLYISKNVIPGIHAWLPIENMAEGSVIFLSPSPYYTAATPSAALTITPVGGYNPADNSIFSSSGRGPSAAEDLIPYFAAPAVSVSTSIGSITGTSAAAAIAAGACILILEWGIVQRNNVNINTVTANSYLISGAEAVLQDSPNNIWGFGKINLYNSFSEVIV